MGDEKQVVPVRPKNLGLGAGQMDEAGLVFFGGIDGDINPQKVPKLKHPPAGETVFFGPYGSHIALGADRLNQREGFKFGGGKGTKGVFASAHVDIVAGLDSIDTYKGRVPKVPVNPDAFRDAARVYISQNCDVDNQFNCADGTVGNIKNKSAVVVKGDQVRIIAREGIKIITGTDSINSRGKKVKTVPPIDLIAGNAPPEMMQPIPRGMNLRDALQGIVDRINQLSGILDNFLTEQQAYNAVIMSHEHYDFVSMGLSLWASGGKSWDSYFGGKVSLSPPVFKAGTKNGIAGTIIKKDLLLHKCAMSGFIAEYLSPFGRGWINSRHVSTS